MSPNILPLSTFCDILYIYSSMDSSSCKETSSATAEKLLACVYAHLLVLAHKVGNASVAIENYINNISFQGC